jgi:sucrose-phosphate synthase
MSKRETDGGDNTNLISVNVPSTSKYPLLRRRRRLFVIALDCYNEVGAPEKKLVQV